MPKPKMRSSARTAIAKPIELAKGAVKDIRIAWRNYKTAKEKYDNWLFDNALRKVAGKARMYYTTEDMKRVVRLGRRLLRKYSGRMEETERQSVETIVGVYEKVIEMEKCEK